MVTKGEGKTSGEIVPVIVRRSGRYPLAAYRAAVAMGLLAPLTHALFALWGGQFAWTFGAILLGFALGRLVPWIERLFTLPSELTEQVQEKAVDAFVENQVFATKQRTGVLLYISVFEHRVTVLADQGIFGRAEPGVWNDVCATVTSGIRSGQPTEGIVAAIGKLAELLERLGNKAGDENPDELPNKVRGDLE